MKRIFLFLAIFIQAQCMGNSYGRLTSVVYDAQATKKEGKVPFRVTIQSSDKDGYIKWKPGTIPHLISSGNNVNIQGKEFDVSTLQAYSFTIPWANWDGDATIHIKVMNGTTLIAQMDLQDRNYEIKVIGIKNAASQTITKIRQHKRCENPGITPCDYVGIECDRNLVLSVDKLTGYISVASAEWGVNCPQDDSDYVAGYE